MKSTDSGVYGENLAEQYLREKKFKILHRNYRTTRYEIDIIAKQKRCLYFVEVKRRSTMSQGSGSEYVTDTKLKQMVYAAQSWVEEQNYQGQYRLAVISVDGSNVDLIDDIWM